MNIPPEVAIYVALIGLFGVVITVAANVWVYSKREKLEQRLKKLESAQNARKLDLEVRHHINVENWKRVNNEVRELKNVLKDLIDRMRAICVNGHETSDSQVLEDTLAIVKLHRDFRDKMKPLFGEIRSQDYERLEEFHRFQGTVLLDIGRTAIERKAKTAEMKKHADRIDEEQRLLEALVSAMLQPRFDYPKAPVDGGSSADAK